MTGWIAVVVSVCLCDRVTIDSIRHHTRRHFPVQNVARATYRVDGNAADVVVAQLDLARVHARPHLEAQSPQHVADPRGAPDRPGGSVEPGEEAVARLVDFMAVEALKLPPDPGIVPAEQLLPPLVTELDRALRESTTSVNSTVARTRSTAGSGRTPVRNSSISSSKVSASPVKNRWSAPSSSTNLAPGMRSTR